MAITAARAGARVRALDLTPELLEQARENGRIALLEDIVWKEGDAEQLPYPDASFDVVLSQFGHMFAPRPDVVCSSLTVGLHLPHGHPSISSAECLLS